MDESAGSISRCYGEREAQRAGWRQEGGRGEGKPSAEES